MATVCNEKTREEAQHSWGHPIPPTTHTHPNPHSPTCPPQPLSKLKEHGSSLEPTRPNNAPSLRGSNTRAFETTRSTSAWTSFWRCNPHAPPFPCSSGSASHTCSDGATRTRLNIASPASVTSPHSIEKIALWAHHRDPWPNASKVHVSIASLASDGGSKFGVLRRFPICGIAASSIAARRSHDGMLPRTCCRGATRQHL